jgi:hypothetical protein
MMQVCALPQIEHLPPPPHYSATGLLSPHGFFVAILLYTIITKREFSHDSLHCTRFDTNLATACRFRRPHLPSFPV